MAAVPDCDGLLKDQVRIQGELDKITKARSRIMGLIKKDIISDEQAADDLSDLKQGEGELRDKLERIESALADVTASQAAPRLYVERVQDDDGEGRSIILHDDQGNTYAGGNDVAIFIAMDFYDKRKLIESVFSEPLPDGSKAGIYLTPIHE